MSGANGALPEITLDELAKLIRILGMMGSGSDGEALNAARFAAKWVREHGTDWQTLLTPEPEPAVSGVVATVEADAQAEAATDIAYQQGHDAGYQAGVAAGLAKAMAQVKAQVKAQAKAQASMAAGHWTQQSGGTWVTGSFTAAPGGFGGSGTLHPSASPQGPVQAPAASGGPPGAPSGALWPPGTWQRVCQDLLDQHAAVPGVLRAREESFVADILRRGFSALTPAQEHWLRDIAGRNHMSW